MIIIYFFVLHKSLYVESWVVVVHWEAETGRSLSWGPAWFTQWVLGQLELHSETLFQNKTKPHKDLGSCPHHDWVVTNFKYFESFVSSKCLGTSKIKYLYHEVTSRLWPPGWWTPVRKSLPCTPYCTYGYWFLQLPWESSLNSYAESRAYHLFARFYRRWEEPLEKESW